jgi:aerobic carbon-monoxide dehydrogenase small subunit
MRVTFELNGTTVSLDCEPRRLLSDVLRGDQGLPSMRTGCEQGVCGSCTVLLDGAPARACLVLAAQVDGHAVETWEGCARTEVGELLAGTVSEAHGLQCGYCTPGILVSGCAWARTGAATDPRTVLDGHLCRCTGYVQLLEGLYEVQHAVRRTS